MRDLNITKLMSAHDTVILPIISITTSVIMVTLHVLQIFLRMLNFTNVDYSSNRECGQELKHTN